MYQQFGGTRVITGLRRRVLALDLVILLNAIKTIYIYEARSYTFASEGFIISTTLALFRSSSVMLSRATPGGINGTDGERDRQTIRPLNGDFFFSSDAYSSSVSPAEKPAKTIRAL